MSKLVLHGEHGANEEFPLDRERISIGRKANSDIQLDNPAVSGNHAVVITLGSDSFLEDLNSTNGTQVNENDVHRCVLQDGDVIRIGTNSFTFVSEALEHSAPGITIAATPKTNMAPAQQNPALDEITKLPDMAKLDAKTALAGATQLKREQAPGSGTLGVIRMTAGPGAGQVLELSRPVTTLGKPGIQVVAISLRDNQYYLGLVEGTDLPLINGSEMKSLPCQLRPHDIITVAGITLEFYLK